MSNLTDLYISASYYGVVNLSDATEPFASQSEARIYLHDGLGEDLGISFNSEKRVSIDNGLTITGSLLVSGSKILTGSLDVLGDITASGTVSAGTGSFDTVRARRLIITIESSSVIYNSGSNIFGDEPSDTQVLSGSVYIPNLEYLAGNPKDTNLRINEKLSTSSFDSFSSSLYTQQEVQNQRLDSIEAFTASLVADFVTDTELSAALEVVTSSLQASIDTKLDTGSYLVDSASFDGRIANKFDNVTYNNGSGQLRLYRENGDNVLQTITNVPSLSSSIDTTITNLSSSIATTDLNQQNQIDALIAETGSYATTGSNTFIGDQVFSGSVQGVVIPLTISSLTASMDCSLGNFFTLQLPTGSDTHIIPTNIQPGLTITLQIKQDPSGFGGAVFNSDKFDFPRLALPNVTPQNGAKDILTFVSFDNQVLNGNITNDLI